MATVKRERNFVRTGAEPLPAARGKTGAPRPTAAQRETIVRMLARGYSPAETAAAVELGGAESAREIVDAILREQDTLSVLQAASWDGIRAALPQAVAVIRGQLEADNQWIAQNAARVVFDLAQKVQQEADASPTISFGQMPAPGMPSTHAEED